jgi:hypothetical protein
MMLDRRRVLRGMIAGASVYVGLPILDCLLNGTPHRDWKTRPPRFGTGSEIGSRKYAWSWHRFEL